MLMAWTKQLTTAFCCKYVLWGVLTLALLPCTVIAAEGLNPWALKSPVRVHAAEHAGQYQHLVFTGTMNDLRHFAEKYKLKALVYTDFWTPDNVHVTNWQTVGIGAVWGACNDRLNPQTHQREVACVAVDSNNQPKDPHIWVPQLRLTQPLYGRPSRARKYTPAAG
jgi:hypothetical protein